MVGAGEGVSSCLRRVFAAITAMLNDTKSEKREQENVKTHRKTDKFSCVILARLEQWIGRWRVLQRLCCSKRRFLVCLSNVILDEHEMYRSARAKEREHWYLKYPIRK